MSLKSQEERGHQKYRDDTEEANPGVGYPVQSCKREMVRVPRRRANDSGGMNTRVEGKPKGL